MADSNAWRSSPAAWAAWARRSASRWRRSATRSSTTYSPGNTKARRMAGADEDAGLRRLRAYPCDVADFESCAACVAEVQQELGPVDVLVNNAGITRDMTFKKMDKANWDAVMRTNLDSLLQHDQAGGRRHGRARLGPHHQRLVGQRLRRARSARPTTRRPRPACTASPRRWRWRWRGRA